MVLFDGLDPPDNLELLWRCIDGVIRSRYENVGDSFEPCIDSRDLLGGPPVNAVPGPLGLLDWSWSPDGRIIYVTDEPGQGHNSSNFWATRIDLRTGKPLDKPRRLTSWTGFWMDQPSLTADGKRLVYRRASILSKVFTASLEGNRPRITSLAALTLNEGRNYPGAWTADGATVVFASDRNGRWEIFKQSLESDVAALPTPSGFGLEMTGAGLLGQVLPRLSPDGAWVLYLVFPPLGDLSSPARLMRTPISGGQPKLVLTTPRGDVHSLRCARSPVTLCVLAEKTPNRNELVFTAFDPLHGRDRELIRYDTKSTLDSEYAWDLSPDGNRIAILRRSEESIHLLYPGRPGSSEIVVTGHSSLQSLDWSADGKKLFVSSLTNDGADLLQVDLRGNSRVLWESKGDVHPTSTPFSGGTSVPWAVPSPDGRRAAMCVWSMTANIWMMENF